MARMLCARRGKPAGALIGLALITSACAPDRVVTGSTGPTYPYDYRARHPITLAEGLRPLDVFVVGAGGLDSRQREDVRAFAAEYRKHGRGPIIAQLPAGSPTDAYAHRTLDSIRYAVAESGVGPVPFAVSRYAVSDPSVASPIRLSFQKLEAKVATKCGLWPQDLGGSDPKFNYSNQPYWNLGCATQANLAAQVADPIDLVRGRTETPGDTLRRTRDIEDLRNGKDPSTVYRQDNQGRINQSVGN